MQASRWLCDAFGFRVRPRIGVVSAPTDHPYGESQYTAADPAGIRWTLSRWIADVDPADWGCELLDAPR